MSTATPPMIDIDIETLSNQERYKLLIGSVVPRPIAFVSTISNDGVPNLAPYSFFTAVCPTPMILAFCPNRRGSDGHKKDTLNNLEANGECVIHIVSGNIGEQMNQSAAEVAPEVSEFDLTGLTPIESTQVKPYRIAEAKIQMECKLHQIVTIGETIGAGVIVLVRVVALHVDPTIYHDGRIDIQALDPWARLAGTDYTRITETFSLSRP